MPVSRDPLAGVRLVVVDATNLAHALARRAGPGEAPRAAVLGRIRAAIPAPTAIELAFDGPPEPGATVRAASALTVRYGGRRPADALVLERVEAEAGSTRAGAPPDILVVTDDAALSRAARDRGATTARTAWLIARMDRGRLSSPSVGNARPPAERADAERDHDAGWRPGRGATAKRGNPRRPPKRSRRPAP